MHFLSHKDTGKGRGSLEVSQNCHNQMHCEVKKRIIYIAHHCYKAHKHGSFYITLAITVTICRHRCRPPIIVCHLTPSPSIIRHSLPYLSPIHCHLSFIAIIVYHSPLITIIFHCSSSVTILSTSPSIIIQSNIHQLQFDVHQHPFVRPLPSTNVCPLLIIIVNAPYS